MADLKFIMHMGEDEDEDLGNDKYSRRPSLSDPARGPNPSSTAKISENNHPPSETDPGSSQPRRRGPLNRSSRPNTAASPTTVTASEDKASPPPRSLSEEKSIDHIEPMDTGHYGSYAHSPSSSNMPPSARSSASSRPPQGEGNIPVRLTPVTGRVSRAKKGVPVHICDICKPSKTFTRAEHLRRHQLSHKPAAFQCEYPGCGKAFHRQDLLTRHTQRHEQDDRSGSTSHQPSHTPVERPHAGYLQAPILPGNTMSIADEMTTNTSYPGGSVSPYSTSHRGSFSGQGAISPSAHSTRSHSAGPSHSHDEYILSSTSSTSYSMHPSSMDGSPFYSSYGLGLQPRKPPSYFMGMEALNVTIPDSNLPGHLSQDTNWPSSASDSPYSTPDMGIRGFESPNADVANEMFYVPHHYPSPQQPVYHPTSDYNTSYADDGLYEMSSQPFSVRSPTPPTVTLSAQPAEHLVTLGLSVPDPPAILGRQKGSAALLSPYSDAAFLTAIVPSTAALNAIPRYLDVYWKRFDTLFPLVHRRSLENSADPVLKCAMAALGSQFLQRKEDRINSHTLHSIASQEARRRPQWSVQTMQAILLCEFYGRFRGSRVVVRASEPFQSLYSRVATPHTLINSDSSNGISHKPWDEWIVHESRRRLLAACFILDIHTSMYHEHSAVHHFTTATPPIPLTKPTQHLWAAQSLEAWEGLRNSPLAQFDPASLDNEEITASHINTAPPLDLAVYVASEALRLPRRSPTSSMGLSADLDLNLSKRMHDLFPGSAVANTYLALHHTPLRDLLAVSGDTWIFSRKILDKDDFQRRKANVRLWCSDPRAGAASIFASKALLIFFDTNNNTPNSEDSTEGDQQEEDGWSMSDISNYWAMYVCALICWSISHRTARGALAQGGDDNVGPAPACAHNNTNSASGKEENEAKGWLRTMAGLSPEAAVQNVRARREALGLVTMVRRRLESEAAGGKSKLLVDAVRVLGDLAGNPNRGRF